MAQKYGEAWLTCALNDDAVINALVLAESLRRTRTTRKLVIIISQNVSKERKIVLGKAFDVMFLMDEDLVPVGSLEKPERAKVFAFSLKLFEKCIFLPPTSFALENADKLFEGEKAFKVLKHVNDGSLDMSMFLFSPSLNLCEYLGENANQNGKTISEKYLRKWLEMEYGSNKVSYLPGNSVLKLSVEKGRLSRERTHAPIIQFVEFREKLEKDFASDLSHITNLDLGLPEKLISEKWLEIYNKKVARVIKNPRLAVDSTIEFAKNTYVNEPIAIVGMSCRLPGANNLEEFWDLLCQGEDAMIEPPSYRWTKEHTINVSQEERKTNAGFLRTKVDEFDAKFFGISPKEAAYMDPQARLLHEVLWESLESGGIDPLSLKGTNAGIFIGSWMNDYRDIVQSSAEKDFYRTYIGNSIGAMAARLAFALGVTGPNIATESGCSSSMVALDLCIKSLRNGDSNLGIVGGVNLLLHPFTSNIMEYVIAPDGRSKPFDERANGFGRAEGCGVLTLKKLSDALRDNDKIWAVIRGSAVSQEGISKSMGTPTVHCEALAMETALKDSGVSPLEVSYVETHGTGTIVGDPMEIKAINKAYNTKQRKESSPLMISSVKAVLGHTESCSGITGVIKTVLAMQNELIPKHKTVDGEFKLNPEIILEKMEIPLNHVPWPKVKGKPRLAGVSSFGITGTDGHVILEEAPDYELPKFNLGLERPLHIMKISGKSSEALDDLLQLYQDHFQTKLDSNDLPAFDNFANASFSANTGRATFNHRAFIIGKNYQDAISQLKNNQYLRGEVTEEGQMKICFIFTGQGSQYVGMAKDLYDSPIFRIHFDACERILQEDYNLSLRSVLWSDSSKTDELSRTLYSQTSIFVVEYCLLKLWESYGVKPDFVLGHSLGEFAAAVAAGALTFRDALMLVAERSRLIDNLPRGKMLVVKADQNTVNEAILAYQRNNKDFWVDYAAINSPDQTVLAGDTRMIEEFSKFCETRSLKAIVLAATHAFHSRHMEPMLEEYRKIASRIIPPSPKDDCPQYISGVEGKIIDLEHINADYWVRHTREKVSFIDACQSLRQLDCRNFLEVGPHPVLSSFVMMNNEDIQMNCFPSLRKQSNDYDTLLTTLGKLYLFGYNVNWKGFDKTYIRKKVSLPFHPFYKKSYWVEASGFNEPLIHPLIGYQLQNASNVHLFQNDLKIQMAPYLKDHKIGNKVIFPGAAYAEMCLFAGHASVTNLGTTTLARAIKLENLRFDAPLELKDEKSCRLQVLVDLPESSNEAESEKTGYRVKVFHKNAADCEGSVGKWVLHASANFSPVSSSNDGLKYWKPAEYLNVIENGEEIGADEFYQAFDNVGLKFGPNFRSIKRVWCVNQKDPRFDQIVAEVQLPVNHEKYFLHPVVLDAAFQSYLLKKRRYTTPKLSVPVQVGKITLFPQNETKDKKKDDENQSNTDVVMIYPWKENNKNFQIIFTQDMTPIALIEDFEILETNVRTIESLLEQQTSKYPDAWEEIWKTIPGPLTDQVALSPLSKSLFSDEAFHKKVNSCGNTSLEDIETHQKTNRLLYLYILNAFYDLGWNPKVGDIVNPKSFCKQLGIQDQFVQLVNFYLATLEEDQIYTSSEQRTSWTLCNLPKCPLEVEKEIVTLKHFLEEKSNAKKVINIYSRVAASLANILSGKESILPILFPTDESQQQFSADTLYQNYPGRHHIESKTDVAARNVLQKLFDANIKDTNKVLRILEVGAGTGSMSQTLLAAAKDTWGNRFEYYYTDISKSFFGKAEKKFAEFNNQLKFAVFNLERSPLEQGIPLNYFDSVWATDVIHATKDLHESLSHIRKVLRPQGILCFTETLVESRDITFIFGLLEGYWRFQDYDLRPFHTCCGTNAWEKALIGSGFESVHTVKAFMDTLGCITADAVADTDVSEIVPNPQLLLQQNKRKWVIFAPSESAALDKVCKTLYSLGYGIDLVFRSTDEINPTESRNGCCLRKVRAESEDPFEICSIISNENVQGIIYAWGMDTVETDQKCVALPFMHIAKWFVGRIKSPFLFIFTNGVHTVTDSLVCNPTSATLFGMAKSLKNENADIFVRYVDFENQPEKSHEINELADQMMFEMAMTMTHKEAGRVQVAYRVGNRYEPRFVKVQMPTLQDELQLPLGTERYHLLLPETRAIKDLKFDTLDEQPLSDNEIEVKVKAYALNFRDIFAILKPSVQFEKMNAVGLDYSGVVTKVGGNVASSKVKVGDRVLGCNFKESQLSSHLNVTPETVVIIPENMTFWESATLPAVFATAYYCLITVAKMKRGDIVLIHTGSGGVGLAAIQLAKNVGAEIITTAGSPRKRAYLKSLGIKHVFNSRNNSFESEILKATKGKGVDIVLNSITGPGLKEASLNSCAKNAKFVEMSKLTIWTPEEVHAQRPDVEYSIVDLTNLEPSVWEELLLQLKNFLENGNIKAIPYVKFDALNIRQALQYFQKAKHIGKIVCAMPELKNKNGQLNVDVPLFNTESTYLITGGLGGIGYEVSKWMLTKGAHNLVLMGRNPPKPEIKKEIAALNEKGYNVIQKYADVSNFDQMRQVFEWIQINCKPLRGVMHLAGVLRDNLYQNQSWDDFNKTYSPKVTGTWNLHQLTKDMPLEHFVFYSSVTALMGTPGQGPHASANCFEDAFAHYRHSLGLTALTINWGQWAEVGCAKEISMTGILPVSVTRMLNGLETTMRLQKVQGCFMDFESFETWSLLCPMSKHYLDEKLWKTSTKTDGAQCFNTEKFWVEMDAADTREEKQCVMGSYLKNIVRVGLRLDEDIRDDVNLQDVGVDSLFVIEMKNTIQTLLGSRTTVTANLFKNCNTVRLLSAAIVGKIMQDGVEEDNAGDTKLSPEEFTKLLEADCQLPEDIHPHPDQMGLSKPSQFRKILLTGSTGQLGPYLLSELTSTYKSVEKVICLIRPQKGVDNGDRLRQILKSMNLIEKVDLEKVECISGDVTMTKFGLDEEKYQVLCEQVDAVIHCAVKANHVENYKNHGGESGIHATGDIRRVNVEGVLNILRLCKPIYYASAYTAIFGGNDDELCDEWPGLDEIKVVVENNIPGYQTSKFVSEILLKQANERGIPCKVFRFPWITGDSQTGQLNYIQNHFILRLLTFLKLRAMPSLVLPAIVAPVDLCSQVSLQLFMHDDAPSGVYNIGPPAPQVEQEFATLAKEEFGIDIQIVEFEEFAKMVENDESPLESLKELYVDVDRILKLFTSDAVKSVKGYFLNPDTYFKNDKVHKYIPDFATKFPSSMEIIKKDLNYVKSKGFFKKFGI